MLTRHADSTELAVKHPLQHRWVMWYDCAQKKVGQAAWGEQLRKVVAVDTVRRILHLRNFPNARPPTGAQVEDFWGLYNNIIKASKLAHGANYHLFKENVEPKWEDPFNDRGGKWIVPINDKKREENGPLDRLWLWTLLACIGESFDDESEIAGCVVSVRKTGDKISLWTKSASNEAVQKRVGRQLKQSLDLDDSFKIGYQVHHDAQKRNSSFNNKNRYEV